MKTILAAYSGVLRGTGSSILSVLQDLSSTSWLSHSKVIKQLQAISVIQWILTFLFVGASCTMVLIYLFCTDCWLIAALYTCWLIFDWDTPNEGGRRSSWVRNWTMWTYFRDFFPIREYPAWFSTCLQALDPFLNPVLGDPKTVHILTPSQDPAHLNQTIKNIEYLVQLVKTCDLLPSRNYIFGYHPHGIFCFGAFCNFSTEATGFSKKFPGIRPSLATLAGNFRMPLLREYLMSGGICPVNRNSIDHLLSHNGTGNAVIIVVGGAAESLDCAPGMNSVTLKNRKGFVKLALQRGADLVPVYSFGENEVYKQVIFEEGSFWRLAQKKLQKLLGFAPCLFHGCSIFSEESWGYVPYAKPITTIVGEPITVPKIEDPSQEVLDQYHAMYITSLRKLFDKHKIRCGLKESDILYIQ